MNLLQRVGIFVLGVGFLSSAVYGGYRIMVEIDRGMKEFQQSLHEESKRVEIDHFIKDVWRIY